jgi:DNA-binding transcriptional MerR regulator
MVKLSELRRALSVTPNTIRNWSADFAPFLSAGANPPTGETRRFTEGDAAVFALIAGMRGDDKPLEVIRAHLAAGARGTWPPVGFEPAEDAPGGAQNSGMVQSELWAEIIATRAENKLLERELEYYRNRSEELQTRAVEAETELMLLGAGAADDTAVSPPGDAPRGSLSERLRRAIREIRGQ